MYPLSLLVRNIRSAFTRKTKSLPRRKRCLFQQQTAKLLDVRCMLSTWTGGDLINDKWSDPDNWFNGFVPTSGSDIIFPSGIQDSDRTVNNDLSPNLTFRSIIFEAAGYTISGNQIKLSQGISIDSGVNSFSTTANVIENNIEIAATSTLLNIKIFERDTLHLRGRISGPTGAGLLITKADRGTTGGTLFFTGTISNTYTGTTTIRGVNVGLARSAGTTTIPRDLIIEGIAGATAADGIKGNVFLHSSNLINDNANITLINKAKFQYLSTSLTETINELRFQGDDTKVLGGGTLNLNGDIQFQNAPNTPPPATLFSAEIVMNTINRNSGKSTNWRFNIAANLSLSIDARLSGNVSLSKLGAGTLITKGSLSNNYTGVTTVAEGSLTSAKNSGVQSIPTDLIIGLANALVGSPTTAFFNLTNGDAINNSAVVTVHANGLFTANSGGNNSEIFRELIINGGKYQASSIIMPTIIRVSGTPTGTALNSTSLHPVIGGVPINYDIADGTAEFDAIVDLLPGLGGNGNWAKNGAGTMLVTAGSNSLNQVVSVKNGTLIFSEHLRNGTTVNVQGGTFIGKGATIAGLNATFGTVESGLLTVAGNVSLGQEAKLVLKLDVSGNDTLSKRIDASGNVVLGVATSVEGFPILDIQTTATYALGTKIRVMQLSQSSTLSGLFRAPNGTVLNEGSSFTVNGQSFTITYNGVNGNFRTIELTRNNPPAFVNQSLPQESQEGEEVTLSGMITEIDPDDDFLLSIDWGDGQQQTIQVAANEPRDLSIKHTYLNEGKYKVQLDWRDPSGGGNSSTLEINVLDVAPTLLDVAVTPEVSQGSVASVMGKITDPGINDVLSISIDWGDKSDPQIAPININGEFSVTHIFEKTGKFKVTIIATDGKKTTKKKVYITVS